MTQKETEQTEQNEKIQLDAVLDHSQHGGRNTIASRCIGGDKAADFYGMKGFEHDGCYSGLQ